MKKSFQIKGMHCNSCSQKIEDALKDKVEKVSVNFAKEVAEVEFNPEKISIEEIKKEIEQQGYEIREDKKNPEVNKNYMGWIILAGSIILLLFVIYNSFGGINLPEIEIPNAGESTSLALLLSATE